MEQQNQQPEQQQQQNPPVAAAAPPKKSNKCTMDDCSQRIVKIIGTCRYCTKNFCGSHRLPETHNCENMQSCRTAHFDRNANKLLGEKCVTSKV